MKITKMMGLLLCLVAFVSCSTVKVAKEASYSIHFLDEYILPANSSFDETPVGGLSGIDFNGNTYALICDHPSKPRFYNAEISISESKIDTVKIIEQVFLDTEEPIFKNAVLDMESIRATKDGYLISTEGRIDANKPPLIFEVDKKGKLSKTIDLPSYFSTEGEQKPRNNAVFEGLTLDSYRNGFWSVIELPLTLDGSKPKLFNSKSPVRFTFYNANNAAETQYAYNLERLPKIPILPFSINGAVEILQVSKQEFLVVERGYSAGHGQNGNTVRLFLATLENATETLSISQLKKKEITFMTKKLLFDFKSVKKQLSKGFIDNIEGISFGPKLKNGNATLLLVADNNFNSYNEQLNQFILLELIKQ